MAVLTISGATGALEGTISVVHELALHAMLAGFSAHINGLRVAVEHGPGYDTVVFAEGAFAGQSVAS